MCGIVGFAGVKGGVSRDVLERMRDSMVHRGPDGCGVVLMSKDAAIISDQQPAAVGLGHRRLSIIDLSEAGAQPMANEDGKVWITYNGEFYNFQDYRGGLEQKGHVFRSHCDTETIIHLYEEHGIGETLRRMNGMFAFGLYDGRTETLILARDRIGKKPLYYAETGGGILFASEIKALLASGLLNSSRLDPDAIAESLRFGTATAPRTIYKDIRMLPHGCYGLWKNGTLRIEKYYVHPMECLAVEHRSVDDFADELEELLIDAIRIRLIADVPAGLFLSGGLDSSLIAALTRKKLGRDVPAYCVTFQEDNYDESQHALRVADHLGAECQLLPAGLAGPDIYRRIAAHMDQPFGDNSLVPTFLVSKGAHDAGLKMVLTGDGGDELFGGYYHYSLGLRLWGRSANQPGARSSFPPSERWWAWRLERAGFARGYASLTNQFNLGRMLKILQSPWRAWRGAISADRYRMNWIEAVRNRELIDQMQYVDMNTMMTDVILRKVDMMSMANSLECRSPLLDYRVLELSARLPPEFKIGPSGRGKLLIRKLLERYIPAELFERPKMGFSMPWETICSGDYAEDLKKRWSRMDSSYLRRDAGDWLFEEGGDGGRVRKWAAFTQLIFHEDRHSG